MKFRRMREPRELNTDPRFDYMVGRLVGAAEMMAHYMALHGDEKARGMAGRVNETLGFFLERSELPAPAPPASEQDTAIIDVGPGV